MRAPTRLVRIEGTTYRVYEGRQFLAEYLTEPGREPTAADVEHIRITTEAPKELA
jgi:hypothetical protein